MENHDIDEIQSQLEGLSIQEKLNRLEEIKSEVDDELDELETFSNELDSLLSDLEDQIESDYKQEIIAALNETISSYPKGVFTIVSDTVLDIEGLRFYFRHPFWNNHQLEIGLNTRKSVVRVRDFREDFKKLLQEALPEAFYNNTDIIVPLSGEKGTCDVIKDMVESLVSLSPQFVELAKKYNYV